MSVVATLRADADLLVIADSLSTEEFARRAALGALLSEDRALEEAVGSVTER